MPEDERQDALADAAEAKHDKTAAESDVFHGLESFLVKTETASRLLIKTKAAPRALIK